MFYIEYLRLLESNRLLITGELTGVITGYITPFDVNNMVEIMRGMNWYKLSFMQLIEVHLSILQSCYHVQT